MLPPQLTPSSFDRYPPEAKRLALRNLATLRRLPLAFAPLLLKEVIVADWKFPAERRDLDRQFSFLDSREPPAVLTPFAGLTISPELERSDWVNAPAAFSEQLTAHLWATHQIDVFRNAAVEYVAKSSAWQPDPPPPTRLAVAIAGAGVDPSAAYRAFRKLLPHGTHYTNLAHKGGLDAILQTAAARLRRYPQPYAHWYIDGAAPRSSALTSISYAALSPARAALQASMRRSYEAGHFDPEAFRSNLARTRPEDVGLASGDAVLNRFALSLLSEGSGTQVFSTTFVQWASREALRRAQPLTLVARFTPRQREKPMNELLAETERAPELDPIGSLVDADMGAYYTWLNQGRLPGEANFLAWFEDRGEAVAISRAHKPGTTSAEALDLRQLLEQLS